MDAPLCRQLQRLSISIACLPPHLPQTNALRLSPTCVMYKQQQNEDIPSKDTTGVETSSTTSNPDEFKRFIHDVRSCLLLMRHSSQCSMPNCIVASNCSLGKQLVQHVSRCVKENCSFPYCGLATYAISHYKQCRTPMNCRICGPVKAKTRKRKKIQSLARIQENIL